jgi:hypothetical protein
VLYLIESAWPSGAYQTPEALWVAPAALAGWLMRIWLLANRGELDDDPVVFAIKDTQSLMLGGVLALGVIVAAFLPAGSISLVNVNEMLGIGPPGNGP